MITASDLKALAYATANTGMDELSAAGVIPYGDQSSWRRFNDNLDIFIIKLPSDRLEKFAGLMNVKAGLSPEPPEDRVHSIHNVRPMQADARHDPRI